jgi:hypothetical protein
MGQAGATSTNFGEIMKTRFKMLESSEIRRRSPPHPVDSERMISLPTCVSSAPHKGVPDLSSRRLLHPSLGRRAPGQSGYTQRRRVSAVIFLNSESEEPAEGTCGEGRLTFHGLLDGSKWEQCPFPLKPEPGLLVAFPSEKIHEVTPVSHGLRSTVVTWFYATEPQPVQPATEPGEPANSDPARLSND